MMQEAENAAQEQEQREEEIALGNPLLNPESVQCENEDGMTT